MSTMLEAVVTAGLAVTTVALWTLRVTLTASGRGRLAAMLAAIEATVFVTVVARLMSDLDDPLQLLAYAGGVAVGTTAAMHALRRFEHTVVQVEGVVPGDARRLLSALHARGWPTTTAEVCGLGGRATTVSVTTTADRLPALHALIDDIEVAALWTETELRSVQEPTVPPGYVQTAAPSRRSEAPARR